MNDAEIKGSNYNLSRGLITKVQNVNDQVENGHSKPKNGAVSKRYCSSSLPRQTRGKKRRAAPAKCPQRVADRYSCIKVHARSPHYLEAIAWHSFAIKARERP